jgi:hypothetical protein
MRDARMIGSWVLALFLAVMFVWIADLSLFPASEARNVVFPLLAEKSDIWLWEPTGRYVTSIAEVLAALLLLLPFTRRLGAILGFLIAGGAVAAQLVWLGMAVPIEQGSKTTDGGQLFYLALALAAASLVLIFVHPGREKSASSPVGLGSYGR